MRPDPKYAAEALYATAWAKPKAERLAIAIDAAQGRVRPEYAEWVRSGRPDALHKR